MRANRRAIRDQLAKRNGSESAGETVTGGPIQPIDLMEVLSRGARDVSRGRAVSGAAQVVISSPGSGGSSRAVALSDGSMISFARVGDIGVLKDEDAYLSVGV